MEPQIRIPVAPGAPFPLPPKLEGLRRLAYNLWWAWHPRARILFSRIDAGAWARYRNPIPVLSGAVNWSQLLDNSAFMADYEDILAEFDSYMANGADHWFQRKHGDELDGPIAYFCAEYGFHESLGIYSGGLGVLAGDHMKTASDMALPLVGIGLMYRRGFFRQTIDADGHQEHAYPDFELSRLPVLRVLDSLGQPLTVSVQLPGRDLFAAVWVAQVGRVPVLLLDTDLPDNDDSDRPITHILYVRGREMRLHQELVLGVGGVRVLRELGLSPSVWHLNEGHSAFLLAERARELVAGGATLDDAWTQVSANSVFTIHTPVSAGNERFDAELVRRVASPLFEGDGRPATGGIPIQKLLDLGLGGEGDASQFDMTALSLRMTHGANAVSLLHGHTANAMWQGVAPTEILGLTNGVHTPSWVGQPMRDALERYTNADLDTMDEEPGERRFWERTAQIPTAELWEAHQRQKLELAIFARGRLRSQFARHGEAPSTLEELEAVLDPRILTIGFARRFATYKRAALLFSDLDRLARLIWDTDRPLQIIFAGKAHPADRPGPGHDPGHLRAVAQPQAPWAGVHPRGLRHPDRPVPGPGRGRLAQQPAPAARGVGDVGHEGRGERRAQRERARRLVGRGLRRRQRLGHRRPRDQRRRGRPGLGRRPGPVPDPGAGADPGLLRARRGRPARRSWAQLMRNSIASTIWRFSTTRMLHEYVERLYLPAAGAQVREKVAERA